VATRQSAFFLPARFPLGTRTLSKNTRLKLASPFISTIGRVVMPGVLYAYEYV